ncbi:MAG: alpha/beta fold hydrolase [Proteobacteria bacterium]|nr:alpha/beta fold hydrolase [Pseudomonadota bacterium]
MLRRLACIAASLLAITAAPALAQTAPTSAPAPAKLAPQPGDFTVKDFKFRSGETLPELRLHYMTLGQPRRDAKGHIVNAVLILHGTGGDGNQFLRPQFADVLFAPGGLLDPARYYIILPDDIGHGKSSKPSDGLRAHFPQYDYDDMVEAEHLLTTKGLGVDRLRLIMGTSMGCMHAFLWGEAWPEGMDALMPLACQPMEIAGRNRAWRRMTIDAIKADPDWKGGDYTTQPQAALRTAEDLLLIAGSAPQQMQKSYPTREKTDAWLEDAVAHGMASLDANDFMYQVASSRSYNPEPGLERITAPVMWVNSADDFINPPEVGMADTLAKRIKHGRYVLIPASDRTHGHGTHTWAAVWQDLLADLLRQSDAH